MANDLYNQALEIIHERYRRAEQMYPGREPRELFKFIDDRCPFKSNNSRTRAIWSVTFGDFKVSKTRPELLKDYKLDGPLFVSQPEPEMNAKETEQPAINPAAEDCPF